ncbi:preprotein translocase subunit SecA [Desulfobulbus rhabdoformis]|nr:preprotein translocase subunit SecA [Desulfobulbus rhabdoformis]
MFGHSLFSHPPADHTLRPEQADRVETSVEGVVYGVLGKVQPLLNLRLRPARFIAQVEQLVPGFRQLSDGQLRQEVLALEQKLHQNGLKPSLVARSFALIRETSWRVLGQRHYPCQLHCGLALLHNTVAEMQTGEGKTLTATLAAATVALAGMPVHVVSVNDYLTTRDAEEMGPLYRALGLEVGHVVQGMTENERKKSYLCPITYVTNKELVFDYLRDRLTLGEQIGPLQTLAENLYRKTSRNRSLLLRGLHFALVDEADSILIDEARTPLIISGNDDCGEERHHLQRALRLAQALMAPQDYTIDHTRRHIRLSKQGKATIKNQAKNFGPLWQGLVWREGIITQALASLHLYHKDEHYLLREGKIEIIDAFTGRVMPDRSWEQGLHQLIEVKEGCALSQRRTTLAQISFQRFFRRYLHLSGMTGTASEVRRELWTVYGLPTLRIPPHRPVQRITCPTEILPTISQKWDAVIKRVQEEQSKGRPVLIGTRSVAASEQLKRKMEQAGLPHQLLNARHDATEAQLVASAGKKGNITIATNMAGRGTDIKLESGVKDLGGLHVILTERHEAMRIDRQLAGRCGRQGDPGSFEEIVSWEDALFQETPAADWINRLRPALSSCAGLWLLRWAQRSLENFHARMRTELFRQDQKHNELLSFSGRQE